MKKSVAAEEGFGVGLTSEKILKEVHGEAAAAFRENGFAEVVGGGTVEESVFLKNAEDIGFENFGPFVGIIAGRVSAGEDVLEGGGEGGAGLAGEEGEFGDHVLFEGDEVVTEVFGGGGVPGEVEFSEGDLPGGLIAFLKTQACLDAFDEFFGDGFAVLVVAGVFAEERGFGEPVFEELGGEFDEVPEDVDTGDAAEGTLAEEFVEGVSEFVKEGAGFVEGEQGGAVDGGGEVGDDGDIGALDGVVPEALAEEIVHPGAGAFGGTGEGVDVEVSDEAGVAAVFDAVGADVLAVDGEVVDFGEAEGEEAVAEGEDGVEGVGVFEVGAEGFLIELVGTLFEFFGPVGVVPGVEVGFAGVLFFEGADVFEIPAGGGHDVGDHGIVEGFEGFEVLGHAAFEGIGGVVGVTEEAGAAVAEGEEFADDVEVAVFAADAPLLIGQIHVASELGIGTVGHEGDEAGHVEGEGPGVGTSFVGGFFAGGGTGTCGEVGDDGLFIDPEAIGLGVFENVFGKAGAEGAELVVDFAKFALGFGGECGAVALKGLEVVFEGCGFFGGEGEFGTPAPEFGYPGVEAGVEAEVA